MAKATSAQGDKPVVVTEQNTETKELATGTQGETLQVNTQELTTGAQGEGLQLNTQELSTGTQSKTDHPSWLIGAFDVKARAKSGFWRCGVHFLNSSATRVFVVTSKADVPADHQCADPCCYLMVPDAQRVYNEPWLTVVSDNTAILD
jgi:hypothetical protein